MINRSPYFENAFSNIDDLIAIITKDRTILKVNKSVCEKYGKPEGYFRGKKCFETFFDIFKPCNFCILDLCEEKQKTVTKEIEDNIILSVSPIYNGSETPLGFLCIIKDLNDTRNSIKIGELLVMDGLITVDELNLALRIQHKKLGEVLIDLGIINELDLIKTLKKQKDLKVK